MKNQAGEKKDANILHVISLEVSGLPLFPTGELFLFGRFLVRIANDEKTMVCSPKKSPPDARPRGAPAWRVRPVDGGTWAGVPSALPWAGLPFALYPIASYGFLWLSYTPNSACT